MTKQLVLYVDNGEYVDAEVVEEEPKSGENSFFNFFSSFFTPHNDNGREYNHVSDKWEYTADRNGNADPCACPVNVIEDYGADTATDGTC